MRIGAGLLAAGYVFSAMAVDLWHSRPLLMAMLFLGQIGFGLLDVSMNLEGASVEHRLAVVPAARQPAGVGEPAA